jgi:hypothetical protein
VNRYETSIRRAVFGVTAVAMTAITIGASVVMPAKLNAASREPLLATSNVTTPASAGVATGLASVDVDSVREPGLSTVPCPSSNPQLSTGPGSD